MKIRYEFDKALVKDIAFNCGSKAVKSSYHYLEFLQYHSKDKMIFFTIDDVCFLGGTLCKKHFRLAEFAVKKDYQGKYYGTKALFILMNICRSKNIHKITLCTSINENAVNFYIKKGFKIIKRKKDEYEMEMEF